MTSFRQAWRALARRRTFACLATVTFAAGIALVTTTFSVVEGVLLKPLPYPGAGQLVTVLESSPGKRERASLIAPARLADWNRLARTFDAISGSYSESMTDTSGSEPERLDGRRVMPRFFDVFEMAPLAGRTFVADEERFGGASAAVIGEGLWTRRFSRSPSAVGSRLTLGGTAYTIVGVMPRAFSPAPIDVWVPAQVPAFIQQMRDARFVTGVGRIKPGVTIEAARDDLARVQQELGAQFPKTDAGWSAEIHDLKSQRVDDFRRPLLLVLGAVGLLFCIAVANVAGLVLVQLQRRATELAVRAAIGASRLQIVAALLREIVLIAGMGAAAGAVASVWLTRGASFAFADAIPRMADVTVDVRALAIAAAATIVAAVLFGVLPAIAASRGGVAPLLASAGRGSSGTRHRFQSTLVVAQLTLGVVLAGGAGLLVRSYGALARVDAGVDPSHVLTFHVGAAWNEDRARVGQLQEQLLARLRDLPGVRAAGFTNFLPASGASLRSQVIVDGLTQPTDTVGFTVGERTITPGYLRALNVPLAAGAWCEEPRADINVSRVRQVMVNRQFIARYANGQDVVGRQLKFTPPSSPYIVSGIVGDVLEDGLASPAVPYVYVCMATGSWPDPEYVVRAEGDPLTLIASVRTVVKSVDPGRPFFGAKRLADVMDAGLDQPRLNAGVIVSFALAALGLAALGLYGLLMLLVTERRRELGVRIALGAAPHDLVRLVVGGAGRLAAIGMVAGLALTLASAQLLRSLLFGIEPYDAVAVSGAMLVLGLVAVLSAVVPARQAARVSAMEAMRTP